MKDIKKYISGWAELLSDTYDKTVGWRVREFNRSVSNLWKWLPIIWKDRNWDDYYIMKVLSFKLTMMAKYFRERDFYVGQIRDAERMETCVRLIEKIQSEEYELEYLDVMEKKWGPEEFQVDSSTRQISFGFTDKNYTQDELEIIDEERRTLMEAGRKKHQKAKRILFQMLERNIEGWWD